MYLKKIIKILLIALIILLCIILGVIFYNKKIVINIVSPPVEDPIIEIQEEIKKVYIRNNYYIIKNCTDKFYSYYMTLFNMNEYYFMNESESELKEAELQNAEVLYNMLDEEYTKEKQVTKDNVKTKLSDIKKSTVNITKMYVSEKDYTKEVYVVEGVLIEEDTQNKRSFTIIIKLDLANKTFSVLPQEYVEERYSNIKIGEEIEISVSENIVENKNNTYKYNIINDERYIKDLFAKLKTDMKTSLDLVYNSLNEEYRNKKFGTFEEFKKYVESNNDRFSKMQIKKYQKEVEDGYTRYVCVDQNENYYIFYETSVMDYTVILDTYTIDILEYVEKYNSAIVEQKVVYNIEKFINSINDKSYYYAYNCLADSYKNNYFKTQEEFENYAKENFYNSSNIEFNKFNVEGEVYTYSVTLTDKHTGNKMKKTFIVKLEEGTDFVLSFDK